MWANGGENVFGGGLRSHQMVGSKTHVYYHHWIEDQCAKEYFWKDGNSRNHNYRQRKAIRHPKNILNYSRNTADTSKILKNTLNLKNSVVSMEYGS